MKSKTKHNKSQELLRNLAYLFDFKNKFLLL